MGKAAAGLGRDSRVAPIPVLLGCGVSMLERQCSSRSVDTVHEAIIMARSIGRLNGCCYRGHGEYWNRRRPWNILRKAQGKPVTAKELVLGAGILCCECLKLDGM